MKTLTTIIILLITLNCYPQRTQKQEFWNTFKVTSIMEGSIILEAISDGLYDSGKKQESKYFKAASIASLLSLPLVTKVNLKEDWAWYGSKYLLLRFSSFNYSYNLTRGLPLTYKGTTSICDKSMKKVPPSMDVTFRGVAFIVGVSINF